MKQLYALTVVCLMDFTFYTSCETIVTVVQGEDVKLECEEAVTNGKTMPLCLNGTGADIEWLKNQAVIANCLASRSPYKLNSTNGVLTMPNISMSLNNAAFACRVSSAGGIRISNLTLIVFQRIELAETTPLLNRIQGENATLGCFVESVPLGFPSIYFTWLVDDKVLQDVFDEQKYTFDYDNHGCNLTIDDLQLTDEGRYKCEVRYSLTTVWKSTTLTVAVPPQSVYIIDVTTGIVWSNHSHIPQTSSQMFTCLATDTKPAAEITWTINGKTAGMESNEEVVGSRLFNTSSTITVPPVQSGQRENLTCTATVSGRRVALTIRLIGQQSDAMETTEWTMIFIANAVPASFLLLIALTIVLWRRRQRDTLRNTNRSVEVRFRRTSTDSLTVPVRSAHYQTTIGSPDFRVAETAAGIPTTSSQQPNTEILVDPDIQNTRPHPPEIPPIRYQPPTHYEDIDQYLVPSQLIHIREYSTYLGENGHKIDGPEGEGEK